MTTRTTIRRLAAAALACLAGLLTPALASAAPSDLDPTFGNAGIALQTGISTGAAAVAPAPGGKIVVSGTQVAGGGHAFAVARFDSDGHLDQTFNPSGATPGIVQLAVGGGNADATAVAVDSRGRVVVVGNALSGPATTFSHSVIGAVRLTAEGRLDTSWNASGDGSAHGGVALLSIGGSAGGDAVAITPGDDVVIAGHETTGTDPRRRIVLTRILADGTGDGDFGSITALGGSGDAQPRALAVDPRGGFFVAGTDALTPTGQVFVAHYDATGSPDPSFAPSGSPAGVALLTPGPDPSAFGVAVEPDGRPLVAGATDSENGHGFVARLTAAGALDPSFAAGQPTLGVLTLGPVNSAFTAIAHQPDGNWALAGIGNDGFLAASVTDAGAPDAAFAPAGTVSTSIGTADSGAAGMFVTPGGAIVAGGVAFASPADQIALVRYRGEGDGSAPPPPGTTPAGPGQPGGVGGTPPAPKIAPIAPGAKGDRIELSGGGSLGGGSQIVAYNWDFNHDGRYTASCPGSDPIGLHAFQHAGTYTVGLQVVNAAGLRSTTTLRVTVKSGAGGPASNARAVDEDGFACAQLMPSGPCVDRVDLDGQDVRALQGACFVEKQRPQSSPVNGQASPGLLAGAARAGDPQNIGFDPNLWRHAQGKLWTIDGPFEVNGLQISPAPGHPALIDERTNLLVAAQSTVSVFKSRLVLGKDTDIFEGWRDVTSASQQLPLPDFPDVRRYLPDLFGFPLVGDVSPKLVNGQLEVDAHLQLPDVLGGLTADVTFIADSNLGLHVGDIHAGAEDVPLGPIELRNVKFDYTAADDAWEGSLCVLIGEELEPCGDVGFRHGHFDHADASLDVEGLGLPVVPPLLYISHIGVGVSAGPPLTLSGSVRLTAGGQIDVLGSELAVAALDGSVTLTVGDPWSLEAQGSLTVLGLPVANAYVKYDSSKGLTFAGDARASIGPVSFDGHISGYVYGLSDFQVDADINACVLLCAGAEVVVSSKGAGACLDVFDDWHPGGGIFWNGRVVLMGDSCDIAQFRVAPKARALVRDAGGSVVGGGSTVDVPGGLPGEVFAVKGTGAAPDAVVTAPDGTVYGSPDGQTVRNDRYIWVKDPDNQTTYVLVHHPAAGTWRVSSTAGGGDVASVQTADGIAPPKVTATVSGAGARRVLSYRVAPVDGQTVTFDENGTGAAQRIGVATGDSGTLRFTPAPGPAGKRTITAFVERNGFPRARIAVATYTAPAPARPGAPGHVRAVRHGATLRVRWGAARGAAGYRIDVRTGDGTHDRLATGAAKRSVTVHAISPRYAVSVAVAATSASGRPGPSARTRLRGR